MKNGTPVGNANLCKSCTWGQFMTGYRDSDLQVICTNASPNFVVPFTVRECSEFSDKFKPTFDQMSKLAIHLRPVRVSSKTAGFGVSPAVVPIRKADEDNDEDEAANVR